MKSLSLRSWGHRKEFRGDEWLGLKEWLFKTQIWKLSNSFLHASCCLPTEETTSKYDQKSGIACLHRKPREGCEERRGKQQRNIKEQDWRTRWGEGVGGVDSWDEKVIFSWSNCVLPKLSVGSQWHTVNGIFKGRPRRERLSPAYRNQKA